MHTKLDRQTAIVSVQWKLLACDIVTLWLSFFYLFHVAMHAGCIYNDVLWQSLYVHALNI